MKLNDSLKNESIILFKDAREGKFDRLKFLPIRYDNIRDENGFTLLHYAAEYKNEKVASRLLIYSLINVNATDSNNYTALHIAVKQNEDRIVDLLVNHGADVNVQIQGSLITPLHLAAKAAKAEYKKTHKVEKAAKIIKLLCKFGAKLQLHDYYNLFTLDDINKDSSYFSQITKAVVEGTIEYIKVESIEKDKFEKVNKKISELIFITEYKSPYPGTTKANLVTQLIAQKVKKKLIKEFKGLIKKDFISDTSFFFKSATNIDAKSKQEKCQDNETLSSTDLSPNQSEKPESFLCSTPSSEVVIVTLADYYGEDVHL